MTKVNWTTLVWKTRGSKAVDLKSTVVNYGLALLILNVLLDHFIGDVTWADSQIAPSPKMTAPKLFAQMRKLWKQDTWADTFQPLHDLTDIVRRTVPYEHVYMVACYFTRYHVQLVFQGYALA